METLSVVLATFNEEKNLADCLSSVKGLASEIIIVDGTSHDSTVEIAKKFGAKVHVTTNPPIFHINKQKAIDMATKDWILQLDADERVSSELAEEIRQVLSKKDDKKDGYWIPRKNWYLGRFLMKGGQYPDYTLRLYRKGKGHLPQKDVHEQAEVFGQVGHLQNPLVHIADPSFKRYILRWNRYTRIMADTEFEKNARYNPIIWIKYLIVLPLWWFLLTYIRHKGFMDSWQGFVFSFFSALRFPTAFIKSL
jgi:glycosyltransferase involved in cell wall biosynthesis